MSKKNRQAKKAELAAKEEAAPAEEVAAPAEEAMPVEQAAPKQVAQKVDFDAWFVMRRSKIPAQHHKEIIKADFKGRGLGQHESLEDFDAALKKYGVKLT